MMMQTPWPTRTRALFVPRKTAPPSTQCQRSGLGRPNLAQRTPKGRAKDAKHSAPGPPGGRAVGSYLLCIDTDPGRS